MPARPEGHHCQSCKKTVVDMGQLTAEEALRIVRNASPSLCVSYRVAADGSLLFRASPRSRGTVAVALAAFLAACQSGVPLDASPGGRDEEPPVQPSALATEPNLPAPNLPAPTSSARWPSAVSTTVESPRTRPFPGVPVPPRPAPPHPVKPPRPPLIQHLAGAPVAVQVAGGLRAPEPTSR